MLTTLSGIDLQYAIWNVYSPGHISIPRVPVISHVITFLPGKEQDTITAVLSSCADSKMRVLSAAALIYLFISAQPGATQYVEETDYPSR